MLEVFTVGGGEYIVNVLNAVAAWSGGGGFRSMLQVVFVMGLIYSLLVLAFNFDWRAWMNWFLQATAIYMMLLVPTVTIKVTDRIDPGLAHATVANVPLGLGVMASFSSQFGDWMTRTAETVFVMPDALKMTNNGIIYGSRLLEKAQTFQITDPVFRANLDEHFKQCVFYDVLLGFTPMETLTNSSNLWRDIGPGSPARAQKFLTRSGTGVRSSIIRCNAAYTALDAQWTAEIDADLPLFAKGAYPDLLDTIAAQRLRNDLGIIAGNMHGAATDPYAYLQQVSVMDAFMAARESFSDAGWDAYAAQRADAQARNTYTSIAQQAMTWVPLLGIVLHVVFYAMFPVIFPLFLFPRTGVTTLRGYGMGFFYLASWGPLYVVLHMFVMNRAANAYAAVAPTGPTLLVSNGITNVNNDIATIAGFMMMSVPFIAAGMARGAMAIAGQATSLLGPAQAAGQAAAAERTLGNYATGNISFQNLSGNNSSLNKHDDTFRYGSGFASSSFTGSNGVVTSGFSDGSNAFDARQAISNFATTPTRTSSLEQRINQTYSEGQSNVDRLSREASESWSAVASRGTDLMRTAERRASSGTENGSGIATSLSRMNTVSDNLASKLSTTFGFTEAESREISNLSQTTGSADAGLAAVGTLWQDKENGHKITGRGDIGLRLASIVQENTGRRVSADQAYNEVRDFVRNEINSEEARSARDSFTRDTSSITNSNGEALTERLGASISHANDVSVRSSRAEEAFERFSKDNAISAGSGYNVSANDSQEFANFATERLLSDSTLRQFGSVPQILHPRTVEQAQVRDVLLGEFVTQKHDELNQLRREMGLDTPVPLGQTLTAPPLSTRGQVQGFGERHRAAVRGEAPNVSVRTDSSDAALAGQVEGRIASGAQRIEAGLTVLANENSAAQERAADLATSVSDREAGGVLGNIPYVSPLVEGTWNGAGNVIGWAADKIGLGGGRSGVAPLQPGERAVYPVSGRISSDMGMRKHPITGKAAMHSGIDIAASEGTPIYARASGEVIRSGHTPARGNFVELRHDDGSETRYFHMQSRPSLTQGDTVSLGDTLGNVGSTGRATGPHLHYEIWKDGKALDPRRHSVKDRE
jgi:conjugal transfer mating pair stabilization protein TraG